MIKTTELMLGNLVEFTKEYYVITAIRGNSVQVKDSRGKYFDAFEHNIYPIPLTEGVLKRLNLALAEEENVHELQNYRTICGCNPIDITPLLSPRYTTHDGVEVWEGDEVWYTFTNPSSGATPQRFIAGVDVCNNRYVFFSSKQACQSYIDSVTRKPIFTTEDGVDVFEGDLFWCVEKSGEASLGGKDKPFSFKCVIGSGKVLSYAYFSTPELAQAYLNKVWAEKEYNDLLNAKK